MSISKFLRCSLMCLTVSLAVSAAELSPIEAEIEAIYAQYANSEDNAELQPIKALKTRALDGSVRDQRAYWYALCVMHGARQEKVEAQEALTAMMALQQQHNDPSLAVDTRVCEAQVAEANNRVHDAFRLFESAYELSQQAVDAFALYRVGIGYAGAASRRGEYEKALKALQTAYRGADLLGDVKRQLTIHASMAWAQFELNQPETALATYAAAKKLAQQHDLDRIHMWLINNEAVVMTTLNRLDEAQQLYEQVLEQSQRYASEEGVLTAYINLSDIQLRKKNYPEAERLALVGLQQASNNRLEEVRLILQGNLAYALAGQKQLRRARPIIEELIKYHHDRQYPSDEARTWKEWSEMLALNQEYQDALVALQNHQRLIEEVNKKDREKAILELQQQYETEKQAKEIELLSKANALKDVELINNQLQKKIWWLLALLMVSIFVVMGLFFQRVRAANRQLEQKNRELDYQSTRDPLTALYNRRYFQQLINSVDLSQSERRNAAANDELTRALYLLDIDHFKRINDKFGHAAGDEVLKTMADRLREGLRDNDVIVRWGGEEFLIFAQQLPLHMVQPLAQRILDIFALDAVPYEQQTIPVSCSIGYSLLPLKIGDEQIISWERAVNVVDMALYLAKAHGRNRAYGITAINKEQDDPLAIIERDLEGAWQNGTVTMQITLGPEGDQDVLRHPSAH